MMVVSTYQYIPHVSIKLAPCSGAMTVSLTSDMDVVYMFCVPVLFFNFVSYSVLNSSHLIP